MDGEQSAPGAVVVLGAAGRVGRAVVRRALTDGTPLVLGDIDFARLNNAFGSTGVPLIEVDTSDESSVAELPKRLEQLGVECSGVVNACYPPMHHARVAAARLTSDEFLSDVNAHLGSSFLVCRTFGEYFAGRGGGSIVSLSSIYGFAPPRFEIYATQPFTMPLAYAVAKAGLRAMSAYFAQQYKTSRVRFNCVSPGGILDGHDDNFRSAYGVYSASGDLLSADDVAGAVCFLLSTGASAITGHDLVVDEGWTL